MISLLIPAPFSAMGKVSFGTLHFGTHAFTLSLTSIMLMIIMLGAGCSISVKEILGVIHRPQDLIVSILSKYIIPLDTEPSAHCFVSSLFIIDQVG